MWLTRLCIRYPVFACMLMAAFLVLGIFSWQKLSVEEYPDVDLPYVMVTTHYPGASPSVVESDVTRPVEKAINSVAGVKRIISTSYQGLSRIAVEFDLGIPINAAVQRVRDKVAAVKVHFRDSIKEPLIERFRLDALPVFSLAFVSETGNIRQLSTHIIQQVVPRLQNIPGVGNVEVVGAQPREVQIKLLTDKMVALGIGVNVVVNALRNENVQLPVGGLDEGRTQTLVEIKGRFSTPADFANLVIAQRGNSVITLGQIARVQDAAAERQSLALLDGQRAVGINIMKNSGANVVALVDHLKERLPAIRDDLPADASMQVVADSSKAIRASLQNVKETLIEGALLAIFIVFLFLGSWRSTIITGLTLPVALAGTVFCLYLFDLSINNMTLMAMSLSIGLLIDDAIVVRENIVRHASMGKTHWRAAIDGTREIGLAVLATTLTIVAVFLPVAFMGGIIGRFFFQFGIAVSCAVLLSMLVSFTLDPMLSSRWHDPDAHGIQGNSWVAKRVRGFQQFLARLANFYGGVIRWALAHRPSVLLIALASLLVALFVAQFIGKEFVPKTDTNEISVKFSTPVDSTLDYTGKKAGQVNRMLLQMPGVLSTYTTANTGTNIGNNKAAIRVRLTSKDKRQLSQHELIDRVRARLTHIHGISIDSVTPAKTKLNSLKPIQVSLQGNDPRVLNRIAEKFKNRIKDIPGLIDLESSNENKRPTLVLQINRQRAADFGLSVSHIGRALRPLLAGETVTSWQAPDGETYDVTVRLPEQARDNREDLLHLTLTTSNINPATGLPAIITLGQVAQFKPASRVSQINRRNLFREVLFAANASGRAAGDIGDDIKAVAAGMQLPAGYRIVTQGANKDMAESIGYAITALLLGLLFIYMILATQFNSFLHPLTIMSSLPLSLVGVFFALLICGSTLNLFSIIGILMLMGLVTKNAILLVDFIQQRTQAGMARTEAIVLAGQTRLRPILMTTCAMIAGMMPLALGIGMGAEQRAPMAHALIGGLITSTLLTFIVVPVVYTYLDDLKQWSGRLLRRSPQRTADTTFSPAYANASITPLDDEQPPEGVDYVGMWYTARLRHGIDDKMLLGAYKRHHHTPHWYSASHRYYDGLAVVGEKLAPLSGTTQEDGIPKGRDESAPSFSEWWRASKLPLHAPAADVKWRNLQPERESEQTPLPENCLFDASETEQITRRARSAGVSSTVWLLWTADRVLRRTLLEPDAVTSWVYPVNLRGATGCERESMNQCGGFMVTISADMTASDVYAQVKVRLARLEHWMQWWLMTIGRWIGQGGVNFVYRCLRQQPGQFTGSYSNLGQWDIPVLDGLTASAPCAASYPVSISTVECNGRRSLAVRIHPVVGQDARTARQILQMWRQAAMGEPVSMSA